MGRLTRTRNNVNKAATSRITFWIPNSGTLWVLRICKDSTFRNPHSEISLPPLLRYGRHQLPVA